MIVPGLVSVTFRALQPRAVVELAAQAGLAGIEWGGDVHAPHGDTARAEEVRRLTEQAGLRVLAYGSYFRCEPGEPFEPVLASALALGAPLVRVWAGSVPSAEIGDAARAALVAEARRAVELAGQAGMRVAFEHHDNTLTDSTASALELLHEVPGARTLWQPPHHLTHAERIESLRALLPWLENVHVFWWEQRARKPLAEGERLWRDVVDVLRAEGRERAALLEFVQGDDPQQLLRDAAVLRRWLQEPLPQR